MHAERALGGRTQVGSLGEGATGALTRVNQTPKALVLSGTCDKIARTVALGEPVRNPADHRRSFVFFALCGLWQVVHGATIFGWTPFSIFTGALPLNSSWQS